MFSVSSASTVENYVAQLLSTGWVLLDDRTYPIHGDDGSALWALNKGSYFAELSSTNANASPVAVEFSILGF